MTYPRSHSAVGGLEAKFIGITLELHVVCPKWMSSRTLSGMPSACSSPALLPHLIHQVSILPPVHPLYWPTFQILSFLLWTLMIYCLAHFSALLFLTQWLVEVPHILRPSMAHGFSVLATIGCTAKGSNIGRISWLRVPKCNNRQGADKLTSCTPDSWNSRRVRRIQ